ncbi:MAG: hypothetical protein AAGJ93_02360 [Bacteroidota bacterium]
MQKVRKKSNQPQTDMQRKLKSIQKEVYNKSTELREIISERQQRNLIRITAIVGTVTLLLMVSPLIMGAITRSIRSFKDLRK